MKEKVKEKCVGGHQNEAKTKMETKDEKETICMERNDAVAYVELLIPDNECQLTSALNLPLSKCTTSTSTTSRAAQASRPERAVYISSSHPYLQVISSILHALHEYQ